MRLSRTEARAGPPGAALAAVIGQRAGSVAVWLGFGLLAWGIVGGLVVEVALRLWSGDPEALALAWPDERRLRLVLRSGGMALAVAAIASVLGALAVIGALRLGLLSTGRRWVRPTALAGLVLWLTAPPYLHALGGMEVSAWARALAGLSGGRTGLSGISGTILVQALALMPLPMLGMIVGLASVPRDLAEAAALTADPARAFRRVWLPMALPMTLAGGAAAFVFSLLDSSTPALFGTSSMAMEVVAEFSQSRSAWRAALVAAPLLVVAALALMLALIVTGRSGVVAGRSRAAGPEQAGPGPVLGFAGQVGLIVAIGYGLGIGGTLLSGLRLGEALPGLVWEVRGDIGRSLATATMAATLALVVAVGVGFALSRPGRGRLVLWGAVLLPLAVPPALIGAGLSELMTALAPDGLRRSPLPPAIAHAARFLPLAVLVIQAWLVRIDPRLLDAARLARGPGPVRWLGVDLPLAAPGMAAAFGLVFCASLGELEASLMTAAPGAGLLSLRVFNYLHYGVTESVAALGLALGAMLWLAAGGMLSLIRRQMGLWQGGRDAGG